MSYGEKRMRDWQKQGIKIESYQTYVDLYEKAGGKCEVCHTPLAMEYDVNLETARLDHNHETGLPRAILCSIHNRFMWPLEQYGDEELIGMVHFILNKMIRITPPESITGDLRGMKGNGGIIPLPDPQIDKRRKHEHKE